MGMSALLEFFSVLRLYAISKIPGDLASGGQILGRVSCHLNICNHWIFLVRSCKKVKIEIKVN
jgi:hypothetical protein